MIRVRHQQLGGHTHLEVRSGPDADRPLALCGTLILDNADADRLLAALAPAGGIQLVHVPGTEAGAS